MLELDRGRAGGGIVQMLPSTTSRPLRSWTRNGHGHDNAPPAEPNATPPPAGKQNPRRKTPARNAKGKHNNRSPAHSPLPSDTPPTTIASRPPSADSSTKHAPADPEEGPSSASSPLSDLSDPAERDAPQPDTDRLADVDGADSAEGSATGRGRDEKPTPTPESNSSSAGPPSPKKSNPSLPTPPKASGSRRPSQSTPSSGSRAATLLQLNTELLTACVTLQTTVQNDPRISEYTTRLQENLAWLAAAADEQTKGQVHSGVALPNMRPPPPVDCIADQTERINALYATLPMLFAKDIARRAQPSPPAHLKRERERTEEPSADDPARKRQATGSPSSSMMPPPMPPVRTASSGSFAMGSPAPAHMSPTPPVPSGGDAGIAAQIIAQFGPQGLQNYQMLQNGANAFVQYMQNTVSGFSALPLQQQLHRMKLVQTAMAQRRAGGQAQGGQGMQGGGQGMGMQGGQMGVQGGGQMGMQGGMSGGQMSMQGGQMGMAGGQMGMQGGGQGMGMQGGGQTMGGAHLTPMQQNALNSMPQQQRQLYLMQMQNQRAAGMGMGGAGGAGNMGMGGGGAGAGNMGMGSPQDLGALRSNPMLNMPGIARASRTPSDHAASPVQAQSPYQQQPIMAQQQQQRPRGMYAAAPSPPALQQQQWGYGTDPAAFARQTSPQGGAQDDFSDIFNWTQ